METRGCLFQWAIEPILHKVERPLLAFSLVQAIMTSSLKKNQLYKTVMQHMHHQIQMLTKVTSQSWFHEHEGWEIFLIFHKFHNLNHSQPYHFHEFGTSRHNNTLELDITTHWKKFLPKFGHLIEIHGLVQSPLNIGHCCDFKKKDCRFKIFTSRIVRDPSLGWSKLFKMIIKAFQNCHMSQKGSITWKFQLVPWIHQP
jgi:hypothetical protein